MIGAVVWATVVWLATGLFVAAVVSGLLDDDDEEPRGGASPADGAPTRRD
jgi:hypothetical protein